MIVSFIVIILLLTSSALAQYPLKYVHPSIGIDHFDVTKFGAKGDNKTLDTVSVQSALDACCKSSSGGVVIFPEPGVFLTDAIFTSDHNCDNCALKVEPHATVRAHYNSKWGAKSAFINLQNVNHFSIYGGGTFDGNGPAWWGKKQDRPRLVNVKHSHTLAIYNVTFVDGANHNLEIGADNTEIAGVNILVQWDLGTGPNTDGIDIHGTPFYVHDCHIDVGDDNIAVHASNVLVEDCMFGGVGPFVHGHGASIGSLGNGSQIENVTFRNIEFFNTHVGPNIKVHGDATSGFCRNIVYENLVLHGAQLENMRINTGYGTAGVFVGSDHKKKGFIISNVTYRNITADGSISPGMFLCSKEIPCIDIHLENLSFKGKKK